jgi:acetamidase/formamidase
MALHTIAPEETTLHSYFSRDLPPALTIDSGDTVRFSTLDAGWGLEAPNPPGHADHGKPRKKSEFAAKQPMDGHALCGPIAVRGAKAGQVLSIQIGALRPGAFGWTNAGGYNWITAERFGVDGDAEHMLVWSVDADAGTATSHNGFTVATAPFFGVMGMPPDKPGNHSTTPPRFCGGNMDCKELTAGTTLYLPIPVDEALFSAGDGHARQGDGELSGTAIECPIESADLTLTVRDDLPYITAPVARTAAGWLTMGFHTLLDEAVVAAINAMLSLMQAEYGMSRKDAFGLASVAVDLRITQIVNAVQGVHAFLPFDAITR